MTGQSNIGNQVAIVGIGCRFPGGIVDGESFWRFLCEGRDAVDEIPADRLDVALYFDEAGQSPGRMATRRGGFLGDLTGFDAAFFGISPREAEQLDPQQRLMLETAWEALEDAGVDITEIEGSETGIYIGQWLSDFEARVFASPEDVDFYSTVGSGRYATSGRISYALGLRGPSLTLDTACSSSLTAVHLAMRSIRSGECSLALAGGVNVILQPQIHIAFSQSGMMAPDGRCKFGDASGDGYVRSEGAGIVVLKPLARAVADGDRIYAILRGSAINNDGRTSGSLGRPSREGQCHLLRAAYRDADVIPGAVQYIEAHGTGTRVGDRVEMAALGEFFGSARSNDDALLVGSVKTNIGHTEGAAGVAGLIKTVLALHHGKIPKSLHFDVPSPKIEWDKILCAIPRACLDWPSGSEIRLAGVSNYGISGSNAHVVLEGVRANGSSRAQTANPAPVLLPLSARSDKALRDLARRYSDLLEGANAPALTDVCWSAATRRSCLDHRAAFVASDGSAVIDALRGFAEGGAATSEGIVLAQAPRKVVFVCPGQGGQWTGMARDLVRHEPVFREALERCDLAARSHVDWSILDQLSQEPDADGYCLDSIDVIQPVLVALAIAYAALLRHWGVEPDLLVGHSMGEIAAAHLAGALDLDEAMRIVCRRSALMKRVSGQGAMAFVDLPFESLAHRLRGLEDRLSAAVSNSPRSSVISGDPEALAKVMQDLGADGVFCRLVKVDVASHSPQMEPVATQLTRDLEGLRPAAVAIPMVSTVTGRPIDGSDLDATYWGRNVRRPVLFAEATRAILAEGDATFIELGPHPVLIASLQQSTLALGTDSPALACGLRDEPDRERILGVVAGLWAAGHPVAWHRLMPRGNAVSLPLYPWQRERHWSPLATRRSASAPRQPATAAADDTEHWLYRLAWEPSAEKSEAARPGGRWLALAADEVSAAALADAMEGAGARGATGRLDQMDEIFTARVKSPEPLDGILVMANADADAGYLPVAVLQAWLATGGSHRPRLWFVTRSAQAVADAAQRVDVEQAALWGAARVVGEEHPELWGGLADLPSVATTADYARLAAHILRPEREDQVAIRSGLTYVLRLVPSGPATAMQPMKWRPDVSYLITGGLGAMGLHIAAAMAERGARRLVLVGRTPLPPRESWVSTQAGGGETARRIAAIRALEARGVAVHVAAVDVGDEAQLRAFLKTYEAQAWPPIKGVVHLAAVLRAGRAADLSRNDFDAVMRSKLRAAQLLETCLPDLDLFVVFSSVTGFMPHDGIANYAAANVGLDALAQDRRARGLPGLSIAWGHLENTGLAGGATGDFLASEFARQGIGAIPPARGSELFTAICASEAPSLAVLPVNRSQLALAPLGHRTTLFSRLVADGPANGDNDARSSVAIASLPPTEYRKHYDLLVRQALAKVLKVAPGRIDSGKPLGTMGLSSLLAMELRNHLEAATARSLPATLAWNYPTLSALVGYLAGDDTASKARETASDHAESLALLLETAALSDAEAAAALRASA